jgi:hypothetical protein
MSVLVFSDLTSFVEKILQKEENKGVEFAEGELETRKQKLGGERVGVLGDRGWLSPGRC